MKKLLAFALLLCMLALPLLACNGKGTGGGETQPQQTEAAGVPLPEPKAEWEGEEYGIIYRDSDTYSCEWVFMEDEAGATINDAIFKRNTAVEDRYGVFLQLYPVANASFENDFLMPIKQAVSAGDDIYSLAAGYEYRLATNATLGDFLDWYQMPNVDLEGPWWNRGFADAASYNNHTYIMNGSLSLTHMYSSYCMFFNQDIINSQIDNGTAEIYGLVEDGLWTYERFVEYVDQFTTNLGEPGWDENDAYGFATNDSTAVDAFIYCFDVSLSKRDVDGNISIYLDPKMVDIATALNDLINKSGNTYNLGTSTVEGMDIFVGMMLRGNTAFSTGSLRSATQLRETTINYGILPYPKWNEAQTSYYSITLNSATAFAIPRTVQDTEFVGTITEALAYYSHVYVRDALYNTVLKYRDAKDVESSRSVDIILDNTRYDFSYIYAFAWGDVQAPPTLLRICIQGGHDYISNGFDSNEKRYNSVLKSFLTNFK